MDNGKSAYKEGQHVWTRSLGGALEKLTVREVHLATVAEAAEINEYCPNRPATIGYPFYVCADKSGDTGTLLNHDIVPPPVPCP